MSGKPLPINEPVVISDTAINDAIQAGEQLAETSAEAALDSAIPIFNLPVIHQVSNFTINEIIKYVGGKVSIGLQQVGTFIIIDTQVSGEKTGISQALANLLTAEKGGDPAQIQAAIQAYQKAQSSLVTDDGSALPVS